MALEQRVEHKMSRHQRLIEGITGFVGQPRFLYGVIVSAIGWIVLNMLLPRAAAPDPPPFGLFQLAMTLTALLVAVMVLITQNRQARIQDQRGHLDLQVNLIAEQKITKLTKMLDEIQRDVPRSSKTDPMVEALKSSVDPHAVVDALEMVVPEPHDE